MASCVRMIVIVNYDGCGKKQCLLSVQLCSYIEEKYEQLRHKSPVEDPNNEPPKHEAIKLTIWTRRSVLVRIGPVSIKTFNSPIYASFPNGLSPSGFLIEILLIFLIPFPHALRVPQTHTHTHTYIYIHTHTHTHLFLILLLKYRH